MHQGFLNEKRETEFFREKEMKVVMGKREFIGKTVNTGDQGSDGEFYVDRMFISFDGLTAAKKEELKKVKGLYPEYIKATDNEDSKAALDYMKNQGYDPIIVGRAKVYEGDYRLYAYDVSKCGEIDSYVDGTFIFTLNGCNPSYLRSGAH